MTSENDQCRFNPSILNNKYFKMFDHNKDVINIGALLFAEKEDLSTAMHIRLF